MDAQDTLVALEAAIDAYEDRIKAADLYRRPRLAELRERSYKAWVELVQAMMARGIPVKNY